MNLIVDQPKQGAGNSNDGNNARTFFSNEQKSSEFTGLGVEIVKRFHIILQTSSSGHIIGHHKYKEYLVGTAQMFNRRYEWYTMTPTVHKVLLHGAEIIEYMPLPIGQLSEEAAESTNKYKYNKYIFKNSC